jgi:NAD(P)-dependent dehydrogenase (short-subunit alcohol dehydrogenase family)
MGLLSGRVAVVTGASRGIGAAIARCFGAEGAAVVCVARTAREGDHRLPGSLETTLASIRADGGDGLSVAADVGDPGECERVFAAAHDRFGPVDVLVNNAALTWFSPVADFPVDRWIRSFAVNVHAPFVLSRLAIADMARRGRGAIINVSSGAARGPGRGPYRDPPVLRGGVLYGTEKAALERFTQGLAHEVYPRGVTVACLSPSQVVVTPGVEFHAGAYDRDDSQTEPPEFMARAALLLAAEPLDRVTGRVCYSQQLLVELGRLSSGKGLGIDQPGSGYAQL